MGSFEFVAIAALRAVQLSSGCRARVEGDHTTAVLAQREVAEGKVTKTTHVARSSRAEHDA
jgi:DNA-directed RNA polymerase subunit K/omega